MVELGRGFAMTVLVLAIRVSDHCKIWIIPLVFGGHDIFQ